MRYGEIVRYRDIWGKVVRYMYGEIQGDNERDNEIKFLRNRGRYRER